jgi:pyruvyl transferase EpsO
MTPPRRNEMTRARTPNPDHQLIGSLGKKVVEMVGAVVRPRTPIALLDFPRHFNVGDAAIWLGEIAALSECGIRGADIRYVCDLATYDRDALRRSLGPDGVILFHGGGNFGDLWPRHQQFRESVVAEFPDRRIMVLPQSIHYSHQEGLKNAIRVFDAHPSLTILARDVFSYTLLKQEFKATADLCPDMAFCLGPVSRNVPDRDVLYLGRNDKEAVRATTEAVIDGADPCDWPAIGNAWQWRASDSLARLQISHRRVSSYLARPVQSLARASFNLMARERIESGRRLLSHGRVMVADRLHAHILALLMGIPHVLLDNSYGKLSRFHECWTSASKLTRTARDRADAFDIAYALLGSAE